MKCAVCNHDIWDHKEHIERMPCSKCCCGGFLQSLEDYDVEELERDMRSNDEENMEV